MDLFSTYLHAVKNKELSDSLKEPCRQLLKDVKPHKDYPMGLTSYYDKSTKKKYDAQFKTFKDFIIKQGEEYLKILQIDLDKVDIHIVDYWVSDMGKHGSHEAHTHTPGAMLSGNYYIDIDPNSSQLVFYDYDADHDIFANLPYKGFNRYNSAVWFVPPEEGLMLMWPANLRHSVQTNLTNKRVAISFNLEVYKKNEISNNNS
jgi:uncharacterized protein (TIGR02466 family)